MAKKTGLSHTATVRIWRAFGLQPRRVENFKFSKDPQFVATRQFRPPVAGCGTWCESSRGTGLRPTGSSARRPESGPGISLYRTRNIYDIALSAVLREPVILPAKPHFLLLRAAFWI